MTVNLFINRSCLFATQSVGPSSVSTLFQPSMQFSIARNLHQLSLQLRSKQLIQINFLPFVRRFEASFLTILLLSIFLTILFLSLLGIFFSQSPQSGAHSVGPHASLHGFVELHFSPCLSAIQQLHLFWSLSFLVREVIRTSKPTTSSDARPVIPRESSCLGGSLPTGFTLSGFVVSGTFFGSFFSLGSNFAISSSTFLW